MSEYIAHIRRYRREHKSIVPAGRRKIDSLSMAGETGGAQTGLLGFVEV